MSVKRRIMLHVLPVAAVVIPCRTAFALPNDVPTQATATFPTQATATFPTQATATFPTQATATVPTQANGTPAQSPPSNPGTSQDVGTREQRTAGSRRTDHFRIGVLGGVGFPRPLAVEGFMKIENLVGLGIEYSVLPNLTVSGVETSFHAIAFDGRVFPFKNAFFVGLRAGRQHLGGDAQVTVPGFGAVREAVSVDSTFINPRVGFLWTWEPGVTLGIDVGVQIPVSTSSSNTIPQSAIPISVAVDDNITRVTNTLGRYALPTVDLLKIGFLL